MKPETLRVQKAEERDLRRPTRRLLLSILINLAIVPSPQHAQQVVDDSCTYVPTRVPIARATLSLRKVAAGAGCGEKQNALEVLVRLSPRPLGNDTEYHRGVSDDRSREMAPGP